MNPLPRDPNIIRNSGSISVEVKSWLDTNHDHYLGFGGSGDALLIISSCWNNPDAKVIFFANPPSAYLISQLFKVFNIPVMIRNNIMGSPLCNKIAQMIFSHPRYRTSGHTPENLNYGDWQKEEKYEKRIVNNVPWIDIIGKEEFTEPVYILCPAGSEKSWWRQRHLTPREYTEIIQKLAQKGRVYAVGSRADFNSYRILQNDNAFFMTADYIIDRKLNITNIDIRKFLRIVNSAVEIFSMDTWLKTYTALCGLKTTVIATKWHGKYKNYGEDVTDYIFLNPRLWPTIKVEKFNDLLAKI